LADGASAGTTADAAAVEASAAGVGAVAAVEGSAAEAGAVAAVEAADTGVGAVGAPVLIAAVSVVAGKMFVVDELSALTVAEKTSNKTAKRSALIIHYLNRLVLTLSM
jgi:hypothetical protein